MEEKSGAWRSEKWSLVTGMFFISLGTDGLETGMLNQ